MLLSVVAELAVLRPCSIPATHGEAMQGEFLRRIATVRPGADAVLHGFNPTGGDYTLSPLMGPFESRRGWLWLQPGQTYWFRITALGPACEPVRALLRGTTRWELHGRGFRAAFAVRRWIERPGENGRSQWSGVIPDAGALWSAATASASREPDRFLLHFYSPTTFRVADDRAWGAWMHLPDPAAVLGSIRRAIRATGWEAREPSNAPELIRYGVQLGEIELRTHMLCFQRHGRRRIGFLGRCEFLLDPGMPPAERLWLHLLSEAARFTGVGAARRWGMGQARRELV